ncbi:MAG: biopolymer transporter ExbD [Pirellulaceae bacterium]
MKITKKGRRSIVEGDLTPMIDMTFQLIAFFMVLINFTQAEQDEKVRVPSSEVAKPPEVPFESSLTLQMTRDAGVILDGSTFDLEALRPKLIAERQIADATREGGSTELTIIVRADMFVETGKVQDMIRLCQDVGFEKFALRAKDEKAAN